jgi:hypothetical protein
MAAAGCICVVCMGLDASAICSAARGYGSRSSLGPLESPRHVCVATRFLCSFVAKGAEIEAEALVRDVRVVGTAVSSCSASSLAAVEFDTLSIDRRDMISSRVDAFKGNIEKREESALVRRLDDRLAPLEGAEMVAEGEWEEWD